MEGLIDRIVDLLLSTDFWMRYSIIITNMVIILTLYVQTRRKPPQEDQKKSVLLVIAHPDDESMFFAPVLKTITKLSKVSMFCFSNGNIVGLGKIREKELIEVSKYYDIKDCKIIDHPQLPDGMRTNWDIQLMQELLYEYLSAHNFDAVITFGPNGVSGHPNHRATHNAVKTLAGSEVAKAYIEQNKTKFYALRDSSLIRKYIGAFDLLISSLESYSYINLNPLYTYKALRVHWSQFVWFRKLFVFFARYSYANTFDLMN